MKIILNNVEKTLHPNAHGKLCVDERDARDDEIKEKQSETF